MKTVRVFISSPGDVKEEREKARQVIEQFDRAYAGRFALVPVLWEDLPLAADSSFQQGIDVVLTHEHGIDVAVFIPWSRLGSPLGTALRRPDGTPYRSGTEREFDLLLEARAQSGGERPAILVYTRDDDTAFRQRLADSPWDRIEEMIAQRSLADNFIRERLHDAGSGTNLRAYHTYDAPVTFAHRLRVHLRALLDGMLPEGGAGPARWTEPPYRGLETFGLEHAAIFQGRDEEVCRLELLLRGREREEGCAFAVIVGASGSGKSSLARAGVAASLVRHNLDDAVKSWRHAEFIPGATAATGEEDTLFPALARALAGEDALPELRAQLTDLADLADALEHRPAAAVNLIFRPALRAAAEAARGPVRLLLIVDQLEELHTRGALTPEVRARFFQALEALARSGAVAVLATLRSDFYPAVQQSPDFLRLKGERGQFDLLAPGAAALQRVIVEPARLAGLRFEAQEGTGFALDQRLFEDALRQPDALPLLQYALRELYEERGADGVLSFAAYEAMGGVAGAVGRRAEETFRALPADVQAALPELWEALVTVDPASDAPAVRRRAALGSVSATPAGAALVEALVAERFLVADRSDAGAATVTLAHEALLGSWPRLRGWIRENHEALRIRARVEAAESRWREGGKHPDLLIAAGLPLAEARELLSTRAGALGEATREFITVSLAEHGRALQRRRRLRQAVFAAVSLLALAALVAAGLAVVKRREAVQQAALARENARDAVSARGQAEATLKRIQLQRAEELLASGDTPGGLAFLAGVLRRDPADRGTAARLLSALRDRSYPRPLFPTIPHEDGVTDVQWTPDGTRSLVVTGKTFELRDGTSGKLTHGPIAHQVTTYFAGTRARFSRDGKRFALVGVDAQIFQTQTGSPVGPLMVISGRVPVGSGGVPDARFSPDGTLIVTISNHSTAQVWNVATGAAVAAINLPLSDRQNFPISLAFSPDGKHLALGYQDGSAMLWDVAGQTVARAWKESDQRIARVLFAPDGRRLFCERRTTLDCQPVRGPDPVPGESPSWTTSFAATITAVTVNPADGTLAVALTTNRVAFVNPDTGKQGEASLGHSFYVEGAAYSADAARLLTVTKQPGVQVWDAVSNRPITIPCVAPAAVTAARLSPDGQRVLVGCANGEVRGWEIRPSESQPLLRAQRTRPVFLDRPLALHPERDLVALVNQDEVRVWDLHTARETLPPLRPGSDVRSVAWSRDGRRLFTGGSESRQVIAWDAASGERIGEPMTADGHVRDLVISDNGKLIAICGGVLKSRVWDAATLQPVSPDFGEKTLGVWFGWGDRHIATTQTFASNAVLFDAATGQPVGEPMQHRSEVKAIERSPDGRQLITGSADGTARVWSMENGAPVTPWLTHRTEVRAVDFHPAGHLVATGSEDATARLWDARTGEAVGEPMAHRNTVHAVSFSPDGKRLATAAYDGTARIWEVPGGRPLSEPLAARGAYFRSLEWTRDGTRLIAAGWTPFIHCWEVPAVPEVPAPDWLPNWAEAVAGQRLNERGELVPVPDAVAATSLAHAARVAGDDVFARTARWWAAPRDTRAISPLSAVDTPPYVRSLLHQGDSPAAAKLAVNFDPGNAAAWGALGLSSLRAAKNLEPAAAREVAFALDRAEALSPDEPLLWSARAWLFERRGREEEAIAAGQRALARPDGGGDPPAGTRQRLAALLTRRGRDVEALDLLTQAVAEPDLSTRERKELRQAQIASLRKLRRDAEAASLQCAFLGIPERDPAATPRQLDLTWFYNASFAGGDLSDARHNFTEMPVGLQTVNGGVFDLRGIALLGLRHGEDVYLEKLAGIPCGLPCRRLRFLHATRDFKDDPGAVVVAAYVVHYADGTQLELPLVNGRDIANRYLLRGQQSPPPTIAWKGDNAFTRQNGKTALYLYEFAWENPRPAVAVQTIDFVSKTEHGVPFVVAIKAE